MSINQYPSPSFPTGVPDFSNILPSGALSSTMPRWAADSSTIATAGGKRIGVALIPLLSGMTVTSISFITGSTGVNTPVNQWFCLYTAAGAKLAVTNDDGATAWAANTVKTLNLTTPYAVTSSGLYYVGAGIFATGYPNFKGRVLVTEVRALAPVMAGYNSVDITNPASAPDPIGVLVQDNGYRLAWVS